MERWNGTHVGRSIKIDKLSDILEQKKVPRPDVGNDHEFVKPFAAIDNKRGNSLGDPIKRSVAAVKRNDSTSRVIGLVFHAKYNPSC